VIYVYISKDMTLVYISKDINTRKLHTKTYKKLLLIYLITRVGILVRKYR